MQEEQYLAESHSQSVAERAEDAEYTFRMYQVLPEIEQYEACDHLFVRRRDGSACAICGMVRIGVFLGANELQKLREYKDAREKAEY